MAEQDPTTPTDGDVHGLPGLRASEVSGLNIEDVDTMRRVLHPAPIEPISKQRGYQNVVVTQAIYSHLLDTDTANFMDTVAVPPSTTDKASVIDFGRWT